MFESIQIEDIWNFSFNQNHISSSGLCGEFLQPDDVEESVF